MRGVCLRAPVITDDLASFVESRQGAWTVEEFANLLKTSTKYIYKQVRHGMLGEPIYGEILRRAGHSADARTIPNAERQKQTIEKMQAAARGFERLRQLAEMAGDAQFFAVAERFKIASVKELPSLAALKQLVEDLESLATTVRLKVEQSQLVGIRGAFDCVIGLLKGL